ncbi:MAG TPA: hypothetical protein ENJ09_06130 [Planctomycetes bacterium]|nr:hypothetical protein [Planctomycetota bacterium]
MQPTSTRAQRARLTILLAAGLLLSSACALPGLDATPRVSSLSLSGDFGASSGSVSAQADLERAGLGSSETATGVRVDAKVGAPHIVFSVDQVSYSGTGTLDATISLGGNTITSGTAVRSEADLGVYSALLLFDLIPGSNAELGIGFGATILDVDASFRDLGTNTLLNTNETIPVPVVAANAGLQFGDLELAAVASGMSIGTGGNSGTLVDIDAFGCWRLLGGTSRLRGSLILGWRQLDIDAEYDSGSDNVDASLTLSGPYLGLELSL